MGRPGTFKRGVSGNRNGRPKKAAGQTVAEMCRAHTAEAVATLVFVTNQRDDLSAAARAASLLLDRGWGRVPQPVEGVAGGPPIALTFADWPESLVQAAQEELARAASPKSNRK